MGIPVPERLWWVVFYAIGKRYGHLLVCAPDRKEARRLAPIQIRIANHSSATVRIISIKKEKVKNLDKNCKVW